MSTDLRKSRAAPGGPGPRTEKILLAADGEPHTEAAVEWALSLARELELTLVGIHVMDPYLKQFYNEIYAQGRREYLEYVQRGLSEKAGRVQRDLEAAAARWGVVCEMRIRQGNPLEQLAAETRENNYKMFIVGQKRLSGFSAWRSRALPSKLKPTAIAAPFLIVPDGRSPDPALGAGAAPGFARGWRNSKDRAKAPVGKRLASPLNSLAVFQKLRLMRRLSR